MVLIVGLFIPEDQMDAVNVLYEWCEELIFRKVKVHLYTDVKFMLGNVILLIELQYYTLRTYRLQPEMLK